jgi:hypothetical protein
MDCQRYQTSYCTRKSCKGWRMYVRRMLHGGGLLVMMLHHSVVSLANPCVAVVVGSMGDLGSLVDPCMCGWM